MKPSDLPIKAQVIYMQFLKNKALKEAIEHMNDLAIDPQGRVLIDVSFTEDDLKEIHELDPSITQEYWRTLIDPQKVSITTVSLDTTADKDLHKKYEDTVEAALKRADSKNFNVILNALKATPKGSIIALQQEFDFHLKLASRVYQQAVPELKELVELYGKGDKLQEAHLKAMQRVNEIIMELYANALKEAFKDGQIDLDILNQKLDLGRKAVTPMAHKILREEIFESTQILIRENSFNLPIKHIAKETTASPNDLLHTDMESGLATWIEGSEVTSHHRGQGIDHLASRRIMTHQYDKDGTMSQHTHPRVQVRVPSLDAKQNETEKWHIDDVTNKIAIMADAYQLGVEDEVRPNKAFVYNLYTSLYHTFDDFENKNKQTQGARQIILGAHQFNIKALKNGTPLCFVQNIPINGFGSALGYGVFQRVLVEEASLMSEIALLHTLYETAPNQRAAIDLVIEQYKTYLNTPNRAPYFCSSTQGKQAIGMIQQIKNDWKKSPAAESDDIAANAAACLRNLTAYDLHFDKDFAKLTQSLSVFLEHYSISGCKSANERAQIINGRVAVLDSLILKKPPLSPEQERLQAALKAFASNSNQSKTLELAQELKLALNLAYNRSGLQAAPTIISLVDQGAAAKAQVTTPGRGLVDSNQFEDTTLTNFHQSKSSAMQAHKGLTDSMVDACTEDADKEVTNTSSPARSSANKILGRKPVDKDVEQHLVSQVGHYKKSGGPVSNHQFASDRLGSSATTVSEAQATLYKGISKYKKDHLKKLKDYCEAHGLPVATVDNPHFFREQFIQFSLSRELDKFDVPSGEDPRAANPEQATAKLEELFSKEGAELYQLALEEERYSQEYMDAVFSTSTTHYDGEKWAERPVIIVAGPSASGKSTAARHAVEKATAFLPKISSKEPSPGNDVVAVDGGVCREVSQMRKLAIRLANQQGYTGISDLHDQSTILDKAKACVQNAVFATPSLGVVIPETFSNPLKIKSALKKIEGLAHTKTIFTRVDGEEPAIFKKVVGFMGSRRAWRTSDFEKEIALDLNSTEDLCESKAYSKKGFYWGQRGSIAAEEWYKKNNKDPLCFLISNDLLLIKPVQSAFALTKEQQWKPAQKDDPGAKLVSRRTFEAWLESVEEIPLDEYIAKTPRPRSIITTTAEQDLISAFNLVETRLERENRQDKIALLKSMHEAILSANPGDLKSFEDEIDKLKAHVKTDLKISSIHRTQKVLNKVIGALDERHKELSQLAAIKNKVDDTSLGLRWQKMKNHQESAMQELFATMETLDSITNPLKSISKNEFTWLNPAFQGSAKESATQLSPNIHDLAKGCDNLIVYLQKQKRQMERFLNALPPADAIQGKPHQASVEQHRQMLQSTLKQLEDELTNVLLPAQKILNGDATKNHSIAKDGLVKTIETAMEEQQDIQIFTSFRSKYDDVPVTMIDQIQVEQSSPRPTSVQLTSTKDNEPAYHYQMVPQIKENMCRRHTISNSHDGGAIGTFYEKRVNEKTALEVSGNANPFIELIAPQFPGGDPKTNKTARENKIVFAFAMALQLLGSMPNVPSKKAPLNLYGTDKEGMQFVYTALLIIGAQIPHMKFNADAIKVGGDVFDPKAEQGLLSTFSRNSCYNAYFKNSSILKDLLKDITELSIDKMGHVQDQKQLEANIAKITTVFKERMQGLISADMVLSPDDTEHEDLSP